MPVCYREKIKVKEMPHVSLFSSHFSLLTSGTTPGYAASVEESFNPCCFVEVVLQDNVSSRRAVIAGIYFIRLWVRAERYRKNFYAGCF